jgi:glyoxylase-like metal-dependent hydrolase (beta-lactamase superfamily II)
MTVIINNVYYFEPSKDAIFDSATYIIDTKSDDGLIIIDPGLYLNYFTKLREKGLDPKKINHCLITHAHLDHYGACYKLLEMNNDIKFYVHNADVNKFETILDDEFTKDFYPGYKYSPVKVSVKVHDNQLLKFEDLEIKCLHTPGHSPGATAYYVEIEGYRIIFAGDIGGSALEHSGGNIDDYNKSMRRLIEIAPDILCEGHEGPIRPNEKAEEFIRNCIEFNDLFHKAIEETPLEIPIWYKLAKNVYEMKDYSFALDICEYLLELDPDNKKGIQLRNLIKKQNPPEVDFIKVILKRRDEYVKTKYK